MNMHRPQDVRPLSSQEQLMKAREQARNEMTLDPSVNAQAIQAAPDQMPAPEGMVPPPGGVFPQLPVQQPQPQPMWQPAPQPAYQPPVMPAQSLPMAPQSNPFANVQGGIGYYPQQQMLSGNRTIPLADGRVLEMGPPVTATQLIQYEIIGSEYTPGKALLVRAIMYIRGIDGRPVNMPTDRIQVQELMNALGDLGVERAITGLIQYWPPFVGDQTQLGK